MSDYEGLTAESKHAAAIEAQEMNLVATLKPRIFIDGNRWCVLLGENVQDGIHGFGDTPRLAVFDFNKSWDRHLPKVEVDASPRVAFVDDAMVSRALGGFDIGMGDPNDYHRRMRAALDAALSTQPAA